MRRRDKESKGVTETEGGGRERGGGERGERGRREGGVWPHSYD